MFHNAHKGHIKMDLNVLFVVIVVDIVLHIQYVHLALHSSILKKINIDINLIYIESFIKVLVSVVAQLVM